MKTHNWYRIDGAVKCDCCQMIIKNSDMKINSTTIKEFYSGNCKK